MPCIICFTAIIFNIILILFSVYIFCQTKIAATHCAAASCGLRPLLYALFCNKLTLVLSCINKRYMLSSWAKGGQYAQESTGFDVYRRRQNDIRQVDKKQDD